MHLMTEAILKQYKRDAFEEGVRYALQELAELYDGVIETDIYAEFVAEYEAI